LKVLCERSNNPGLRALLRLAQVSDPITTYDISFKIGPRINAAGRIAHANSILALFEAKTDEEATKLALKLDALNSERQHIQHVLIEKLKKSVLDRQPNLDRVIILAGSNAEGFHRGVIGIACSKMVEMTGRPAFICSVDDEGIAHGSARSIRGFHLVEALDQVSDLLLKYGGHPMAAGFTIAEENLEEMRLRLNLHAEKMIPEDEIGRTLTVDAEIGLDQASIETARSLQRLEPHGIGNPAPMLLLRSVPLGSLQLLKEKHLKLVIGTETGRMEALWWNAAEHRSRLEGAKEVSLICRLEINRWNGRENCQLKVIDAAVDKSN
jgi:single-stranded-DNA-specific exonuclease